jgi:hypothetical protein
MSATPLRALDEGCVVRTSLEAAPAVAVAENVTESTPATLARKESRPAVEPSVQVTDAAPEASLVEESALTLPPPASTVHFTTAPWTAFPCASVTRTLGAVATAVPAAAVCASPATIDSESAALGMKRSEAGLPCTALPPSVTLISEEPAVVELEVAV